MSSRVLDAVFVTTATQVHQYPRELMPEVAFVGRSNVGKSSMINSLAHRKKLVRVSNTPGRTRTLNFFDVTLARKGSKQVVRLCDLPGYGFAKVAKTERHSWKEMIGTYLKERQQLKVVVSIIDAEVGPTEDDVQMINFLSELSPRIFVVATKLDRLAKAQQKPQLQKIQRELELPDGALMGFSAVAGTNRDAVWDALIAAVE